MRVRGALLAVAVLSVAVSCGGGDPQPDIVLDGSPRYPTDQGVATEMSFDQVTLDGERTYKVSKHLRSFSTATLKIEPMLRREGQYVLIGAEGDTITWMAGVAQVVPEPVPTVYYTGTLIRIDGDRRLIFRDGTVLQLAEGYEPEVTSGPVLVKIDVETHRVRAVSASG